MHSISSKCLIYIVKMILESSAAASEGCTRNCVLGEPQVARSKPRTRGQARLTSADGAAAWASGRDSAGAREREENDHEEDYRGDAERNVELGDQIVLPSRFFIHRLSLSVCAAAQGRANLAGFTCPVDHCSPSGWLPHSAGSDRMTRHAIPKWDRMTSQANPEDSPARLRQG